MGKLSPEGPGGQARGYSVKPKKDSWPVFVVFCFLLSFFVLFFLPQPFFVCFFWHVTAINIITNRFAGHFMGDVNSLDPSNNPTSHYH